MYREFYGFSEDPFNLTPDPSFLFSPPGYDDVRASIESGIKERKGVMVITGEVGTGKTTLINALLKGLSEKIKTAFVFNPNLSFKQLLKILLWELKIPVAGASTSSLRRKFNEFLRERMARDENVLIIIDEAQNLTPRILDDLDRLCQQVPSDVNSLQILLVGQLELESKLNSEEVRRFRQRVTLQKQVNLLSAQESRQYVDHRLRVVGSSSSKVFTPEAVEGICEYAKGVPRVINLICDGALFAGYEAKAPIIDGQMVRKAIAANEITLEEEPFRQKEVIPGIKAGAEEVLLEEKEIAAETKIIPGEESSAEKEEIGARKETPVDGYSLRGKKVITEEGMEEKGDLRSRQEAGPPRESLLYLKVGIPALFLACLAFFSLVIWFQNRVLPLKEEEQILSLEQRPIEQGMQKSIKAEEKSVRVEEGWSLFTITKRFYGWTNPGLIDLVLEANPEVSDLNQLQVQQSIKIPQIREELLLIEATDHTYKIHLDTFVHKDQVRIFRDEPSLTGKKFEIVPRKVSPQETWYRLLAGPFAAKDEALESIRALKKKGLLPFFSDAQKIS